MYALSISILVPLQPCRLQHSRAAHSELKSLDGDDGAAVRSPCKPAATRHKQSLQRALTERVASNCR
jgi:hypothetical protein